ncbi:hypothetical protein E0500_003215 [Streptomyces sp. KM273126]|uniref:N,N-dimethylformamidase beta subunit family domain-containing protein n=1 Tax=Streptomyces sp. KM273126 TaxID=2545247 RepID=UPI00103F30D6|nr:N,N-dimethylformamidase beta subunit family domain-containing protein [Streptomyces sp. KM273126]MBA2806490.1 hypothetical protein [Streptomyces sp. KM273126]
MARGYPQAPSALPGATLELHVASDAAMFRFDFFRQGASVDFFGSSPWFTGPVPAGAPAANVDFGWSVFTFDVPDTWQSGVYVAVIVEWDGNGNPPPVVQPDSLFDFNGQILFVLQSVTPGNNTILYKVPVFTYHAYNITGGGAFYVSVLPSTPPDPPGAKVTLLRPGSGTGGDLAFPTRDYYDQSLYPATFVYWDAPFIAWLEAQGYGVDYCTDLDIHVDPALLHNYRLLLSVGHDEYWSEPMRSNVEEFIASGGNVAFFSGNTCWSRVFLVDGDTAMVKPFDGPLWWNGSPPAPENSMTGVSYRNGGGWYSGKRDQVGYTIQFADHWVFDGTSLYDGQVIGNSVAPPVVGYECDGTQFQYDNAGRAIPTTRDQTPQSFAVLGLGLLSSRWDDLPDREPTATSPHAATMGIYANNGTVFTAATTEWPRVAAGGQDAAITRITENVISVLSGLDTVDVTAITGRTVHGPVTAWQTTDGPTVVEHLGGVDANGAVVEFARSPQVDWRAVDVSALAGRTLATGAALTSWQVPDGSSVAERLGGVDANGNVVLFYSSPAPNWSAMDVSAPSGLAFAPGAALASWWVQTLWPVPGGPSVAEYLAGVDDNGSVIVFSGSPQVDWRAVDVSALTGRTLAPGAPLTAGQVDAGLSSIAYLAGVDLNGNVIVFSGSPQDGWRAVDVSALTGRTLAPGAPLTSWQVPEGPSEAMVRLAGVDADADVIVFTSPAPQTGWFAVDTSTASGLTMVGGLTSWQLDRPGLRTNLVVEKLAGVSTREDVQVLTWSPAHDWSSFNVSRHTGMTFTAAPASWTAQDGQFVVEHLAAPTPTGSLGLVYWRTPN